MQQNFRMGIFTESYKPTPSSSKYVHYGRNHSLSCYSANRVLSFLVVLLLVLSVVLAIVILVLNFDPSRIRQGVNMATLVKPREERANLPYMEEESTGCSHRPQPHLVLLPELCLVHYPNGTVVESTSYLTAYCSNCLCPATKSGNSSEDRCCCSPDDFTNITYTCPNYFSGDVVTVSDIPVSCSCRSCSQLRVSFIVRVLDVSKVPVALANVTVDGRRSYQSDDQGYVGFVVSAGQVKVDVSVRAFLFKDFHRHYFVIPGSVNKLAITLQAKRTATLVPPQNPFIIRFSTLDIAVLHRSISFTNFMLDDLIDLVDLMDTFDLYHGEVFAYFPPNVFPENRQFTFVSPAPHTLHDTTTDDTFDISFLVPKLGYSTNLDHTPLISVGWGQLEIYDEDGRPFDPSPSVHSGHYSVLVGLNPSLYLPQGKQLALLYAYNDTKESFNLVKKSSYIYQSYPSKIQWAVFPNLSSLPPFPLRLAVTYEEEKICYFAARVHDPFRLIHANSTRDTTIVRALVKIGVSDSSSGEYQAVFHNSGPVNSCIAIPCHDQLSLEVLGDSQHPTSITVSIGDLIKEKESEKIGPVYSSLQACEAFGLESDLDSSNCEHLMVGLVPSYCPVRENDKLANQKSFALQPAMAVLQEERAEEGDIEFCSVKVLVRMCSESITTVTFVAGEDRLVKSMTSEVPYTAERQQPGTEEEVMYDEVEYQSGDDMYYADSDCDRVNTMCFSFACESRVNLSVVNSIPSSLDSSDILGLYSDDFLLAGANNSQTVQYSSFPCLPHSNLDSPADLYSTDKLDRSMFLSNIAPPDSAEFVFKGSFGRERGVFRSLNTKEVAQQKCADSDFDNVGVYFDCVARE